MKVDIYWIPECKIGRLGIMARPRAGDWLEDEVKGWQWEGVDVMVSLLTKFEMWELGLEAEGVVCENAGIQFISYPIPDRQVPQSTANTRQLLSTLQTTLHQNKSVAIHCRMGVGRSALLAALLLTQQGIVPERAFSHIQQARRLPVPDTDEQRTWVKMWQIQKT